MAAVRKKKARAGKTVAPPPDPLSRQGWALRREVLGEEFHRNALERYEKSELTRPMLDLASRVCWGEVWQRPGLTRGERCLVNLGTVVALRLAREIKTFVRGGVRSGLTFEQIREALLQTAIYCGFPAAVYAFKLAQEVFDEPEIRRVLKAQRTAGSVRRK